MAEVAFGKKKTLFVSKLDLNLRKRLKCYIWSIALCGAETETLQRVDHKYQESFETWCWRTTD
jgi:hypothetical protein